VAEADLPRLAGNCTLDEWTFTKRRETISPAEVLGFLKSAY